MADAVKEREVSNLDNEITRLKQFKKQLEENISKEQEKEKEVIVSREQAEKSYADALKKLAEVSDTAEKAKTEQKSLVEVNNNLKNQTRALNAELENTRTESYTLDDVIKKKRQEAEKTVILDLTAVENEKKNLLIVKGNIEVQKEMFKAQEIKSKEAKVEAEKIIAILAEEKNIVEKKTQEFMEMKAQVDVKATEAESKLAFAVQEEARIEKKKSELLLLADSLEQREKKLVESEEENRKKKTALEAEDLRLRKERADVENIKSIEKNKRK